MEMGNLRRALREDMAIAARAKIIEFLQHYEAFPSTTPSREQCFHTCRILGEKHTPRVPLKLIG
jgi:hypothetical protein